MTSHLLSYFLVELMVPFHCTLWMSKLNHSELKLGIYCMPPNTALNSLREDWCLVHFCIISALWLVLGNMVEWIMGFYYSQLSKSSLPHILVLQLHYKPGYFCYEGKRRRQWQRIRWLGSITEPMDVNLTKLWEIVEDKGAWCATFHRGCKQSDMI